MGRRIAVAPFGNLLSHVGRLLEIARLLRDGKNELIFCGSGKYFDIVQKEGFDVAYLPEISQEGILGKLDQGRVDFHSCLSLREFVERELVLFRDIKPDLTISDFRYSLQISCEILGIPLVTVNNAYITRFSKLYRPYSVTQILYQSNPLARSNIEEMIKFVSFNERELRENGRRSRSVKEVGTQLDRLANAFLLKPINRVRKRYDLRRLEDYGEVFEGDLNLLADIPGYVPVGKMPSNVRFVGPIVWEPADGGIAVPEFTGNRPLLYCTLGSSSFPQLYTHLIETFKESEYDVIVTSPESGLGLGYVSSNIFVADLLPASRILARAKVMIFHGGNGSMYQAIDHLTPMIGVPRHWDHEWNTCRVEELGLGVRIPPCEEWFYGKHATAVDSDFVRKLRGSVRRVIAEPAYLDKLMRYRSEMKSYGGASDCVRYISQFQERL
jgi:UDP:flavonoid glycosyltransferase YjiC (YdhE family)